jgi:predicted  nucleic acid-binding Zn-ribbon protein
MTTRADDRIKQALGAQFVDLQIAQDTISDLQSALDQIKTERDQLKAELDRVSSAHKAV